MTPFPQPSLDRCAHRESSVFSMLGHLLILMTCVPYVAQAQELPTVQVGSPAGSTAPPTGMTNRQAVETSTNGIGLPAIGVFGGYSYLPELDSFIQSFADPGHGFGVGMSVDIRSYMGIAVDFDAHWWTVRAHGNRGDQDIRLSFLSLGPRFILETGPLSSFGMPTFDFQWSEFSEQTIVDPQNPARQSCCGGAGKAFGFGVGGGMDIPLSNHFAVRAIQVNYSLGGFGEGPGRKLRLKTGIVYRFD